MTEQVRVFQKANPTVFARDPVAAVRAAIEANLTNKSFKKTGNTSMWDNVEYGVAKPE